MARQHGRAVLRQQRGHSPLAIRMPPLPLDDDSENAPVQQAKTAGKGKAPARSAAPTGRGAQRRGRARSYGNEDDSNSDGEWKGSDEDSAVDVDGSDDEYVEERRKRSGPFKVLKRPKGAAGSSQAKARKQRRDEDDDDSGDDSSSEGGRFGRTEKMADAHMMSQIEKYWRDSTEMPSTMPWFMVGV